MFDILFITSDLWDFETAQFENVSDYAIEIISRNFDPCFHMTVIWKPESGVQTQSMKNFNLPMSYSIFFDFHI